MDDAALFALARGGLEFNDPMDRQRAVRLASLLRVPRGGRVLDLGCGQGSLLLAVVEASEGATGEGVDLDAVELGRARAAAAERGLGERVRFVEGDAAGRPGAGYDAVTAVGASHVWGGIAETAAALAPLLRPGGRALVADGFWAVPPTARALAGLGAEEGDVPASLETFVGAVRVAGLEPVDVDVASPEEWDAFEAAWRAPLEASSDPRARALAADRRVGYEQGYRGVLGFAFVVAER